jgi:hypothetical protein
MKWRPERTKTETKAEQKLERDRLQKGAETRTGPFAEGSLGLREPYVSPRASFYIHSSPFHLRFKLSATILGPVTGHPPLALSFRRSFRTECVVFVVQRTKKV